MVGCLKPDGRGFCVEYTGRQIQVFWTPGTPEPAAKAWRWIEEALPRFEKLPETMLRDLIGSEAQFESAPVREEKSVEWRGKLADGGSIKLVYLRKEPLSDVDYREGVETLATWISSYFS